MNRKHLSHYPEIQPFITKDGSTIRELMHPGSHGVSNQSLAEARIPPAAKTILHQHHKTEEIYYIIAGTGLMTLASAHFNVTAGDSICIPPGTAHAIENTGDEVLVLLCCCAPAYTHDDTELLENSG